MLGLDPLFFPRQMGRERSNGCGPIEGGRIGAPRAHRGGFDFELLECRLKLGDLVAELLGCLAELHALEAGKLDAQVSIRISRAVISARAVANAASSSAIRASLSGAERAASDTANI